MLHKSIKKNCTTNTDVNLKEYDINLEYCLEILRSFELDTHNCNWLQIHLVAKQGCLKNISMQICQWRTMRSS